MQTTMEEIKNAKISDGDLSTTVATPCSCCGEETHTNVAFAKIFKNAGTCRKCHHALFCFLFLHEVRKCTYQKKDQSKAVAENNFVICSDAFRQKYGIDWRDQLKQGMPDFENRLAVSWKEPINVGVIVSEAKEKGYLRNVEQAF